MDNINAKSAFRHVCQQAYDGLIADPNLLQKEEYGNSHDSNIRTAEGEEQLHICFGRGRIGCCRRESVERNVVANAKQKYTDKNRFRQTPGIPLFHVVA